MASPTNLKSEKTFSAQNPKILLEVKKRGGIYFSAPPPLPLQQCTATRAYHFGLKKPPISKVVMKKKQIQHPPPKRQCHFQTKNTPKLPQVPAHGCGDLTILQCGGNVVLADPTSVYPKWSILWGLKCRIEMKKYAPSPVRPQPT